jgi:hypothetical protein
VHFQTAPGVAFVDVGELHDFGLAVLPAQPREHAELVGDRLLVIDDETEFRSRFASR